MRNAQVQHAQQSAPCHVVGVSRGACCASRLNFLRSCSLVVALINTKEVRVWPFHGWFLHHLGTVDPQWEYRSSPHSPCDLYSFTRQLKFRDFFSLDFADVFHARNSSIRPAGHHSHLVGNLCCTPLRAVVQKLDSGEKREWPSSTELARGLQVAKVATRATVCDTAERLRSSISRRGRNLSRTAHPLIIPMGIGVRSVPRVRTRVIMSPAAAVDLETGEEQAQLLDWHSPPDTVWELTFSRTLGGTIDWGPQHASCSARCNWGPRGRTHPSQGASVDSSLAQRTSRVGVAELPPLRAGDEEVKTRACASMTRTPRPSTTATVPAHSQSTTACRDDLRELVTEPARWMGAIKSVPSDHHQVSMLPARSGISTPPILPRTVTRLGTEWACDRRGSIVEG